MLNTINIMCLLCRIETSQLNVSRLIINSWVVQYKFTLQIFLVHLTCHVVFTYRCVIFQRKIIFILATTIQSLHQAYRLESCETVPNPEKSRLSRLVGQSGLVAKDFRDGTNGIGTVKKFAPQVSNNNWRFFPCIYIF